MPIDPSTGRPLTPEGGAQPTGQAQDANGAVQQFPRRSRSPTRPTPAPSRSRPPIRTRLTSSTRHSLTPFDPNTGQPYPQIDPNTGRPFAQVDPNTGRSLPPDSGAVYQPYPPFDANTAQPYQPIDPSTGQPFAQIDPNTGQPYVPVDPNTGQPYQGYGYPAGPHGQMIPPGHAAPPQDGDSLSSENLLGERRIAPSSGWRRAVYKATAGNIHPGESQYELRRRT